MTYEEAQACKSGDEIIFKSGRLQGRVGQVLHVYANSTRNIYIECLCDGKIIIAKHDRVEINRHWKSTGPLTGE